VVVCVPVTLGVGKEVLAFVAASVAVIVRLAVAVAVPDTVEVA